MAEIDNSFFDGNGLPGLILRGDEDREGAASRLQRAREEREESDNTTETQPRTDRVNIVPEGQQVTQLRLAEDVVRRETEVSGNTILNLGPAQPTIEPGQNADVIVGNNAAQNEVGLNQFSGNLRNIRGVPEPGQGPQAPALTDTGVRGPIGQIQQTFRPEFGIDALDNEQIGQPNLIQPGEVGFIARVQQAATGEESGPQQFLEPEVGNPNLVNQAEGGVIGAIQATFRPEFGLDALDEDEDAGQGVIGRIEQAANQEETGPRQLLEPEVENPNLVNQAEGGVIGAIQATFRPEFGLDALDEDENAGQGVIGRIEQAANQEETGPRQLLEPEVENPNLVNQAEGGVIGAIQATFRPEFGIDALDADEDAGQGFIERIQQTAERGREIGQGQDVPPPPNDPNIANPAGQGPIDSIQQRAAQPEPEFGSVGQETPTSLLNPGTEGPIGRVAETVEETETGDQRTLSRGVAEIDPNETDQGPIGNIQQAQVQLQSQAEQAVNLQEPNLANPGALGPLGRIQAESDPEQRENPARRQPESNLIDDTDQGPVEEIQRNLAAPPELELEPVPDVNPTEEVAPGPVGAVRQTADEASREPNIERLNENPAPLREDFLRTDRPLRENRELRNVLENQPEPEVPVEENEPAPEPVPAPPIPIQDRVATTPEPTPPVVIEETPPVPPPTNEPVEVEAEVQEELTVEQQLALALQDAEEVPPPPPPDPEAIVTERGLNLNQII